MPANHLTRRMSDMAPALTPVTLHGTSVRLEPLTRAHADLLAEAALDPELWRVTVDNIHSRAALDAWIDRALAQQATGTALPFALVEPATGRGIGGTRFGNADLVSGRVEIGWTWVGRAWQRTRVNTEAKYLLLRHAFDTLGLTRVELKTDAINARSRAAIRRIGATEEGTLRRHTRTWDGRLRDSVYFSIIAEEWPAVRERLEGMLAAPSPTIDAAADGA